MAGSKKLKIAVLIDVLYPYMVGGGQKRMYEIYSRLAKKHDIHFFTMHWKGMPKKVFKLDGITVHPICEGSQLYALGRRKVMPSLKYALAIIPHLIKNNFDIIDCNEFPFLHIIPARFFKKKSRLWITWHEVWKREYWAEYAGNFIGNFGYLIQKICTGFADRIIPVSEHTKKDLVELIRVRKDKLFVVPNGVNVSEIKKTKAAKEKSDIIFIGRLIAEKNVDSLIKTVDIVRRKIPEVKCTIIGEGPELDDLLRLRDELKLQSNIKFTKFLSKYADVVSLMKSSKVFVTASIREGFGIVIIEAMACGLPVIAVDHPSSAVSEIIEDGGILSKLDERELSKHIITILKDRKKRKKLSVNAKRISEKYDWKLLSESLDKLV